MPPDEALHLAGPNTILVVVDTNRPEQTQVPELLDSGARIVVIDHHRRAASYIEKPALSFHDPYASSASELVAELVQYILDTGDPEAPGGRGPAGRHCAGHQGLYHAHRQPYL